MTVQMVSDLGGTVLAMAAIVVLWVVVASLAIGIGVLVARFLGLGARMRLATFLWLGIAAVVAWLFSVHLVLPLDSIWAKGPLALAGVAGLWMHFRPRTGEGLKRMLPDRKSGWIIPAGGLVPVLVLANLALTEPGNYDSYFYHFASIRHYSEFAAIEGLVNLHHRLAFQAATLPLASLLDLWPFDGEGFRLVNGFLAACLVFEISSRLRLGLSSGRLGLGDVLLGVAIPVLLFIPGAASPTGAIASPSLDTGAAILCLVAFAYFVDALADRSTDRIGVAFVILCLAATFRQLNLIVLVLCSMVLAYVLWKEGIRPSGGVWKPLLAGVLILAASGLHSTVVSGYPFYPATFPSLGLPWAHPPTEAAAVREFITQFARGTLDFPVTLTGPLDETFAWLEDWVDDLRQTGQLRRLFILIALSGVSLLGILVSRNRRAGLRRFLLLMVPLMPTVVFWFVTAPLLRFGFGPIALVFATPVALMLASGRYEFEVRSFKGFSPRVIVNAGAVGLVLLMAVLLMSAGKYGKQGTLLASADGSGALGTREPKPVPVAETTLAGGVEVYRPTEQTYCGFELWCTIETQFGLKLRGDSFEDGFERLDPADDASMEETQG